MRANSIRYFMAGGLDFYIFFKIRRISVRKFVLFLDNVLLNSLRFFRYGKYFGTRLTRYF